MPTVPTIERKVVTQPLRANRLSTNVPVGDMSGTQNAAMEILKDAKKTGDTLAVNEAFTASLQESNTLLYNEDNGALNARGKDAHATYQPTLDTWDAHVEKTLATLQNDDQKNAYLQKANARRIVMDGELQRHISVETLRFDNKTAVDGLDAMKKAAIENASDETTSSIFINAQKELIADYKERNGGITTKAIDDMVSNTHKDIITQKLVDGNDEAAVEYFKKHKGEISDSLDLQGKLNIANTEGKAARTAQDKFDSLKADPETGKRDITEALRAIRKSGRPQKEIDNAIKRLKVLKTEDDARIKGVTDSNVATVYTAYDEGAKIEDLKRTKEYIDLDGKTANAVIKDIEREQRVSTAITQEQLLAYNDVASNEDLLGSMSREAVVALRPEVGQKLTDRLLRQKDRLTKESRTVRLEKDTFVELASQMGFDPTKKRSKQSTDDKLRLIKLRNRIEDLLLEEQAVKGRRLSPAEIKDVMQKEMEQTVMREGSWFGAFTSAPFFSSEVPRLALTEEELALQSGVPAADREEITRELLRRGRPATEAEIRRIYSIGKGNR